MKDFTSQSIGQSLSNFQAALNENGESLELFLKEEYISFRSQNFSISGSLEGRLAFIGKSVFGKFSVAL